jgi:hypothetical protein
MLPAQWRVATHPSSVLSGYSAISDKSAVLVIGYPLSVRPTADRGIRAKLQPHVPSIWLAPPAYRRCSQPSGPTDRRTKSKAPISCRIGATAGQVGQPSGKTDPCRDERGLTRPRRIARGAAARAGQLTARRRLCTSAGLLPLELNGPARGRFAPVHGASAKLPSARP